MAPDSCIDFKSSPRVHHCEPAWRWNPPVLKDFDFWSVLGGRGTLRIRDQCFRLQAGSAFLLRPGDRVEGEHDPRRPLRVVAFHFLPCKAFPLDIDTLPRHRELGDLAALEFYAREAARPNHRSGNAGELRAGLAALALLTLLDSPDQSPESRDARLHRAAEFARSAPGQVASIAALAQRFGMDPAYFSRSFKQLHGETPIAFWNRARTDRAATLLRETRLTLDEVADTLGYCNVYHFSKQFKAHYGRPPGVWREKIAEQAGG